MRRRAQRLTLVAFIAAGLVACNLIAGFESEYEVGSTSGVVPPSEGGGGEEASSPDGGTDAPVGPDSSTPDAPVEAAVDASFCRDNDAGKVVFCDDFEGPFEAGKPVTWDSVQTQASTLGVAAGEGKGSTKALRVVLTQTGQVSRTTWLLKSLGALVPHYEAEFDVRASTSTLVYAALASMGFPGTINAAEEDHGLSIGTGITYRGIGGIGTPLNDPAHGWHHVRIVLDRTSGTIYSRQLVVDTNVLEQSSNHDLAGGTAEMRLGIFFTPNGATATQEIFFDNVVIRQ